jgi:hypothetical protein
MGFNTDPAPIGKLAAELLLKRLHEQGVSTSNRHIVDYLPADVAEALYDALFLLTDHSIAVMLTEDTVRRVEMRAIRRNGVDVLPYLVISPSSTRSPACNCGSEGYASSLRDHYAVDADRPRLLVVLTPSAIETQKSAQDSLADRALVTLNNLLQEVLNRSEVLSDAPLRKVAAAYCQHQDQSRPWSRVVENFEEYVEVVAAAPPEIQGAQLPMLGCFLPDPRPDFADAEPVRVLEDKDQRRRQRGEGRLFDNALLHDFLTEAFEDPVVDAEHILKEVFEDQPEKATQIAGGGKAGLASINLETFAGMGQRRQKRQKNEFDRATLRVEGAAFARDFGQGSDTIVVVSSPNPFTISFGLSRPFNPRKEHAQLGTWNQSKSRLDLKAIPVVEGASEVTFQVEPDADGGFSVWRLALTRGPRSLRSTIDSVLVVIYHSDRQEIVVEDGRSVSLEDQAWVAEGTRNFVRYTESDTVPINVVDEEPVDASRDSEARPILRVLLDGSDLMPHVVDERPLDSEPEGEEGRYAYETALELACSTVRRGYATTTVMRRHDHYLDAVVEVHEGQGRYRVDLGGGDTREVWAHHEGSADPFRAGQAVGQCVLQPTTCSLDWYPVERRWQRHEPPTGAPPTVQRFLEARTALLVSLRELAERVLPRFRRVPDDAAVPVTLLPIHRIRAQVETLLDAWKAAVDDLMESGRQFGIWHDLILQIDTMRMVDPTGVIERVVVLPTHPWMLGALAVFQDRFARNVRTATERKKAISTWVFELSRTDVLQMFPRTVVEDWYLWEPATRLLLADSPPFHLEFVSSKAAVQKDPLDYVRRVVANKVERYLRMHPHLRDERRTLRIGFVNPGSGRHLLDGLEIWLRVMMRDHAGRIRELPMEQIPAIDVFLFTEDAEDGVGSEFEGFFRAQVSASDEDVIRQALLARLQYRFCGGRGPASARESVHICFVHGLVKSNQQQAKTGLLGEWWDGGFGDGLLSTYLRRTLADGPTHGLHSRRGLWIDPDAEGRRGALARLMALQRSCRDSDLALDKAVYWETSLPDLRQMAPTYTHSDWVVHLDRELSLEIFRRGVAEELPTIIEYSDQEVPESPGYDTITATRHATPYLEQLGEILTLADLDVAGRGLAARTAANAILDDINILSGSWALDFLLGSIADQRMSMRLKGNVGAALVYRWLRRIELNANGTPIADSNVGPVVPVFISLEDLLRATPAAGLSRKDGLVYRYTNELPDDQNREAARWCDDLLVLYLTPSEPRIASRIYGRVIEVKFGKSAGGSWEKAVAQVQNTQQLLQERLAGDDSPLDAPFRHKQLSLLIKAQLEQAVAMGLFTPDVYDFLNVPALSANLATGNYSVDYMISQDGQHLRGDAFLLHTANNSEQVQIEIIEGVRVVTVPRKLVEWLTFEQADSPTLTTRPAGTFPRLGRYGTVQTQTGVRRTREEVEPTSIDDKLEGAMQLDMVLMDVATPMADGDVLTTQALSVAITRTASEDTSEPTDLETDEAPSLDEACRLPIKAAPYPDSAVVDVVKRLERGLMGHKVRIASPPSPRETDRGPRLIRVYVRLEAGESISAVRRISEDIARVVGTATSDIHITNIPERHAVGLDLPLSGLTYSITWDELVAHPSFVAAQHSLHLGFCAGIDVTGRPVWVDLANMPHMLVAGTTGSGKTVFLRTLILTLLLHHSPREMVLRLSSSKPMDFRIFTQAPHAQGREIARDPAEALSMANDLVDEMERRYRLLDNALCDNLAEYNRENPDAYEPYVIAVFDEYSEMIASFHEKSDKDTFESAVGRLAQKARAAGIHLVVCMQRPDANTIKGAIKANILHRFALKLPQNHDSRIILDESGAETLLGQGDLLYKDADSKLHRLQVPFLENSTLKRHLHGVTSSGGTADGMGQNPVKTCPKCGRTGTISELFGTRKMRSRRRDGSEVVVERPQSYCRSCRAAAE